MDVYFGVTLQEITEVGKDSLSGVFWLNLNWADANLVWGESDYDGVSINTTENTNDKVSR